MSRVLEYASDVTYLVLIAGSLTIGTAMQSPHLVCSFIREEIKSWKKRR